MGLTSENLRLVTAAARIRELLEAWEGRSADNPDDVRFLLNGVLPLLAYMLEIMDEQQRKLDAVTELAPELKAFFEWKDARKAKR
jgi:hypothetical protein